MCWRSIYIQRSRGTGKSQVRLKQPSRAWLRTVHLSGEISGDPPATCELCDPNHCLHRGNHVTRKLSYVNIGDLAPIFYNNSSQVSAFPFRTSLYFCYSLSCLVSLTFRTVLLVYMWNFLLPHQRAPPLGFVTAWESSSAAHKQAKISTRIYELASLPAS
jgi:hypothetical protein